MSRHTVGHRAALLAIAIIMMCVVPACARRPVTAGDAAANVSADYPADMNASADDEGMNAIEPMPMPVPMPTATAEPPPPAALGYHPESAGHGVGTDGPRVRRVTRAAPAPAAERDNAPFAGLGAFVKPPVWTAGKTYTLEFAVGRDDAGLAAASQNHALTGRSRIWMAPMMRVTLDSHPDFDLTPQNADQEIQQLSPDQSANWFWNVVPHKAGRFTLVARVQAVTVGPDGEPVRDAQGRLKGRFYPAQPVDVRVRVDSRQGAINAIEGGTSIGEALGTMFGSWQKALIALAALITAAGGVWAAARKLKGKPIRPGRRRRAA